MGLQIPLDIYLKIASSNIFGKLMFHNNTQVPMEQESLLS
jgi:hypothetical protein